MLKRYLPLAAFFIVAIAVFIFAENQLAYSFRSCVSQPSENQRGQSTENDYYIVTFSVERQATCSLRLIDRHNGFFAALASLVIAGFTFTLWRSTNRQADLTREAMIAGERAFVFPTGLQPYYDRPTDPENPTYFWRFRPVWKNSGDTPTKNMTMAFTVVLRDEILPKGFDFTSVAAKIGTALIPPVTQTNGGLAPTSPDKAISSDDLREVVAGKKFLYAIGWAKYWDVFPDSDQHITRFCYLIFPKGDLAGKDVGWDYSHHTEGNCADDECRTAGI